MPESAQAGSGEIGQVVRDQPGLAIEDGKLKLDDPVLQFFPNDAPADVSDNLRAMTVRDLLTMTCGHETEAKKRVCAGQVDLTEVQRTMATDWTLLYREWFGPLPTKP